MSPTLIILIIGVIVGVSCAWIGCFLILRQLSLLGDAISHAVLPGIVLAFLLTGDRSPLPMVIGAGILGVLTVVLVELFHRSRRLKEDASIGVVFPALFSIGVLLISRYTAQVDLDLDCVLYGEIAYAPWDLLFVGERSIGPKALWVNGSVLVLNGLFILSFFKELKLTTFDAGLAAALGFSPVLMHYLLMTAVSITVVGAFESVGAILVVAMLVVPPATAYLCTDRLGLMLGLAGLFGALSAVLGYGAARAIDASIAGSMATVTGLLFLAALLASPRYGLIARSIRRRRLGLALAEHLLMAHLQHGGRPVPESQLAGRFSWSRERVGRIVERLRRRDWVSVDAGALALTAAGAAELERSGHSALRHRPPQG